MNLSEARAQGPVGLVGLVGLFGDDEFHARHLGPDQQQQAAMLAALGCQTRDQLISETVPAAILQQAALKLPEPISEAGALAELRKIAEQNKVFRSYIGVGYYGTITPEPIRRNILENPGWYTAYTPYQAEIAQGRLEALLNFQQMVIDLTALPIANASLLDEASAAAEAMGVCRRASKSASKRFLVDSSVHPQSLAVIRTRAHWMGIEVVLASVDTLLGEGALHLADAFFGAYLQSPDTHGCVRDFSDAISALHSTGARVAVGSDLMALMLIKSPGEMGADIALGSAQRFGVPMGYGGPHAAFMSAREDLMRLMPGRIIGVSQDAAGNRALRMALQTREQHIRRDKATSNICTAQALLANMASFYAVYHGPQGLLRIALRINGLTRLLALLIRASTTVTPGAFFDTLLLATGPQSSQILSRARTLGINLRTLEHKGDAALGVSLDETVDLNDIAQLARVITGKSVQLSEVEQAASRMGVEPDSIPAPLRRSGAVLSHPVFNSHHSETEFVRYAKKLENKDLSLVHSMIPLGSCTMKLNAASEMAPVSWPEFANLHPFAPTAQAEGYRKMLAQLGDWLAEITGFHSVSFQPNSGAQGEYAGILAIRNYLAAHGEGHRDVCLIPSSAHGTNPATASMMGMRIVVVACDENGNINLEDLRSRIDANRGMIAALMITYPSTHGVFEAAVNDVCSMVHAAGGQVYMDGANLNAQAGLTKPGLIGADVCHMNLHKTFCIPHGGGGPGMGPIAVAAHLAPYLPLNPNPAMDPGAMSGQSGSAGPLGAAGASGISGTAHAGYQQFVAPTSDRAVSAAPFGSALITTISWMYIRMMGASGIRKATELAILNANYVAHRLREHFPILYTGSNGRVAHECILDLRNLKADYGITAEDVAKRLMDYGFHAPTLSFPVTDTLMVEPTESESKPELDLFCDAMISIANELNAIKAGSLDAIDNPLKNAPHTAFEVAGEWTHSYSREQAAYPLPWVRGAKFWPSVKRIDNAAGDRKLICTCPPVSDYE